MSRTLERAIVEQMPGARRALADEDFAYVEGSDGAITRYRLSPEAKRIALLEREGRPLDIQPGDVALLAPFKEPE